MLPANDIENLACVESTRFIRSLKRMSLSVMRIILLLFIPYVLWLPTSAYVHLPRATNQQLSITNRTLAVILDSNGLS